MAFDMQMRNIISLDKCHATCNDGQVGQALWLFYLSTTGEILPTTGETLW